MASFLWGFGLLLKFPWRRLRPPAAFAKLHCGRSRIAAYCCQLVGWKTTRGHHLAERCKKRKRDGRLAGATGNQESFYAGCSNPFCEGSRNSDTFPANLCWELRSLHFYPTVRQRCDTYLVARRRFFFSDDTCYPEPYTSTSWVLTDGFQDRKIDKKREGGD